MITIADSGSSKSIWAVFDKNKKSILFNTKGYNPYHISSSEIISDLRLSIPATVCVDDVRELHFFGAGCSTEEKIEKMKNTLSVVFKNAVIQVCEDMHGAAIALFGTKKGIACILGSGSNAACWNGKNIISYTKPLGYLIGDEGSGTQIGMLFLRQYLRKTFDKELTEYFSEKIKTTDEKLLDALYDKTVNTKLLLSSFVPLIHTRINHPDIIKIVEYSFSQFIDAFIKPVPKYYDFPLGFCGSVAFFFQDILKNVLKKHKLNVDKIIKDPVEELIKFYSSHKLER